MWWALLAVLVLARLLFPFELWRSAASSIAKLLSITLFHCLCTPAATLSATAEAFSTHINQQTRCQAQEACAAHFQLQKLLVLIHTSMICSSSGSAMLLCGRKGAAPSALAPRLAGCSAVLRPCPSRPQRCSSQMPGSQIRGQAGSEGSALWLPPSRPSRASVQAQAVTGEAKIKASSRPCQEPQPPSSRDAPCS